MKFLFSLLLIIASLLGVAVCFLSSVVVNSSLAMIDGLELSVWLGVFFIIAFLNGVFNLFSTN